VDSQIHRSWRNRPAQDRSWSNRESADPEHQRQSDAFQARGVPPSEVAEKVLDALKTDRFYVFNSEHWQDIIHRQHESILGGTNPLVYSWGPDLRRNAPAR
jgi:hypothetical protein